MQGIRRDYEDNSIPKPGEYGKDSVGQWYCVPPNQPELLANISGHQVTEHEDGTITVSPSILVSLKHLGLQWHGYLECGIFREV